MKNAKKIILATLALVALTTSIQAFSLFGKSAEDILVGKTWYSHFNVKEEVNGQVVEIVYDCEDEYEENGGFVTACSVTVYGPKLKIKYSTLEYLPDPKGTYYTIYHTRLTASGKWSIDGNTLKERVDNARGFLIGVDTNIRGMSFNYQGKQIASMMANSLMGVSSKSTIDSYDDKKFTVTDPKTGEKTVYSIYEPAESGEEED